MKKNSARKLLYGSAAALAVVARDVAAATIGYLHREAVRDQSLATENLARSVKQTVDAMVENIDYVLQVSSDEIERQIATENPDPVAITRYLTRQQQRFPHIDLLRAPNAQGEAVYGEGVDPAQRASPAQRTYYQRLRNDPSLGMVIAEPIVGRISQKWIWLMARRVNAPDGSFAGLVYASIFIDELARLFEQLRMPPGSVIALRDQEMKVVARTTFDETSPLPIGDSRLSLRLQEALRRDPRKGTYESDASAADGVHRLFSYRRSEKYGFTILVGIPAQVVAAQWRPQAAVVVGSLGVFLTGLLLLVAFIRKRWEQRSLAESLASRERERAFLKSLIQTIPDMV